VDLVQLIHDYLEEQDEDNTVDVSPVSNGEFVVNKYLTISETEGDDIGIQISRVDGFVFSLKVDLNDPESLPTILKYVMLWKGC
jgi:hypothetical protein